MKYLEGQYSKALELIQQSLDIDSSNSYAYKNKALVFLKIGQPESALANLQKSKLLGYEEDYGNEVNEILSTEFSL